MNLERNTTKLKFRIYFTSETEITLPIQYKHIIQAAFLKWLQNDSYTSFIHSEGYSVGKRNYKLYVLSDILSKGTKVKDKAFLTFSEGIEFIVSTCISEMDETILNAIEEDHPFLLGKQELFVQDYEEIEEDYTECTVMTVSPITIHSTFELPYGGKKTYYYTPTEKNFSNLIRDNLIRKYSSIYGVEPEDNYFEISLVDKKIKKVIVNYKGTVIIGWKGRFYIKGNPELIRIALLCGIGARNGIGMGALLSEND